MPAGSTIRSRKRSAREANKPLLSIQQEKFCHLYANNRNGVKSYQEAFPDTAYGSAAQLSSKLLRNDLVIQRIQAIVRPTAKRFSTDDIKAEFRNIFDHSKSEHIRVRILEDLAKIEGMFIEKSINLNANVEQRLPDLSTIPVEQLEQEFIKRMKLEHSGVETFKQLPVNRSTIALDERTQVEATVEQAEPVSSDTLDSASADNSEQVASNGVI